MSDVTITEFLTARYDEDDQAIDRQAGYAEEWTVAFSSGRLLVDLQAKRRIVELARKDLADADASPDDVIRRAFNRGAAYHAHNVLLHLAAVYADHPDYREEWKP